MDQQGRKLNKSTAIPENDFLQTDENLLDNIIITEKKNALTALLDRSERNVKNY